jgi:hypothetical protein
MTPSSSSSSSTRALAFPALRRLLLVVALSLALLSSQVAVVAAEPTNFVETGNTAGAPVSGGNGAGPCNTYSECINGCRSHFYKVTGASSEMTASSCASSFFQQFYVWRGTGNLCSTFTCVSTYRIVVRMCVCVCACTPLQKCPLTPLERVVRRIPRSAGEQRPTPEGVPKWMTSRALPFRKELVSRGRR